MRVSILFIWIVSNIRRATATEIIQETEWVIDMEPGYYSGQ